MCPIIVFGYYEYNEQRATGVAIPVFLVIASFIGRLGKNERANHRSRRRFRPYILRIESGEKLRRNNPICSHVSMNSPPLYHIVERVGSCLPVLLLLRRSSPTTATAATETPTPTYVNSSVSVPGGGGGE